MKAADREMLRAALRAYIKAEEPKPIRQEDFFVEDKPLDEDFGPASASGYVALTVQTKTNSNLRAAGEALQRIEDGSYGVCFNCEEDILLKRLRAVPWAVRCTKCQEAADEAARSGIQQEESFADAARA